MNRPGRRGAHGDALSVFQSGFGAYFTITTRLWAFFPWKVLKVPAPFGALALPATNFTVLY